MLHNAIKEKRIGTVKQILSAAHNIDERDINGNTPLHLACYLGDDVVIEMLIANGAYVNYLNNRKQSALMLAICGEKCAMRKRKCLKKILTSLLKCADLNLDSTDMRGNTALHLAVLRAVGLAIKPSCIRMLIECGASITSRNDDDKTPYDLALENHAVEVIDIFIRAPLCKNKFSNAQGTPKEKRLDKNLVREKMSQPINSSDEITKKRYKVSGYLCPECKNPFRRGMIVLQCHEGHIFCHACKEKMTFCPQCHQDIQNVNIRNRFWEHMIANSVN